jgi:hypothetical protein
VGERARQVRQSELGNDKALHALLNTPLNYYQKMCIGQTLEPQQLNSPTRLIWHRSFRAFNSLTTFVDDPVTSIGVFIPQYGVPNSAYRFAFIPYGCSKGTALLQLGTALLQFGVLFSPSVSCHVYAILPLIARSLELLFGLTRRYGATQNGQQLRPEW